MASLDEWIKWRKKLVRDPRVLIVSRVCHTNRVTVRGALVTLWCLADEYAEADGRLPGYTPDDIDAECELPGFCRALPPDWMRVDGDSVYLPNYQEHNGTTAKKRAEGKSRQRRHRSVTDLSRDSCDKRVTRGRGRVRVRDNPPSPPVGGNVGDSADSANDIAGASFDTFWSAYPKKVGKGKAREAWAKLRPGKALAAEILGAVHRQRGCADWLRDGGRYIPNPATWLNQHRWEDEPEAHAANGNGHLEALFADLDAPPPNGRHEP